LCAGAFLSDFVWQLGLYLVGNPANVAKLPELLRKEQFTNVTREPVLDQKRQTAEPMFGRLVHH
jgi:hypothetical protein